MAIPLIKEIPLQHLKRGMYQPRVEFEPEALEELADSIRAQGVIQPIVVRPISHTEYEIVAGERRWRASHQAGLTTIPCLVRNFTDAQAAAVAAIENIQRENLNPIEEAMGFQRLIDEFHYLHEELAVMVGVSRTKITNSIRLLRLDARIQQWLIGKVLSSGHGKVLLGLCAAEQFFYAQQCVLKNWSVRQLEIETKNKSKASLSSTQSVKQDANVARLERVMSQQLGSDVKFESNAEKKGGWLKIRYFDHDTLEGLLDRMGIEHDIE